MKSPDSVKEKAMQKLKEIKAKSDDSGSKARQYLDGLLKIPFNVYRKEPVLNIMSEIKRKYINMLQKENITNNPIRDNYTSLEILTSLKTLKTSKQNTTGLLNSDTNVLKTISSYIKELTSVSLKTFVTKINEYICNYKLSYKKLKLNGKNMGERQQDILTFVETNITNKCLLNEIFENILDNNLKGHINENENENDNDNHLLVCSKQIEEKYNEINSYMLNVKTTLDDAIYGHNKAKKQIERIIGQWINGKQDGYCFGFEGPPGTGKTTLAKKGLASCLKDENGVSRPFAMIQMGGDSNGSSLHGHNYTYVGSTWGSIVQILIDKKCMNPIIFIDEIDKISKTEHGKEIVGILTHLLDPAQNDCFQDKYFSGIDLDLSKALFILSYNDIDAIDKIKLILMVLIR
jgi:ATP-dependent Lon protease